MDALGTAQAVVDGVLSREEVVAEARHRIDALNPVINAVIVDVADSEVCSAVDGRFAGVPLVLKDLGACLAGLPLYQGSQLLRRMDWRALQDAPIARRIRDAGFAVIGKTNTPEFGAGAATHPKSFGPTRNPWNLEYSTSGSSGGAAAAVAAGLLPVAHGNDFGGSIRMPAAWCGVIGLKPSRGRVDTSPAPPGPQSEFFLTRSLRDAAALLDVVADAAAYPIPEGGWLRAHTLPPRRSRIGLITAVANVDTDASVATAAIAAARSLESAGHEIIELDARFLADDDWDQMQLIARARGARTRLDALQQLAGHPLGDEDAEPLMLALAELAPTFTDAHANDAAKWQLRYAAQLAKNWAVAGIDAAITPTTGIRPRPLDVMKPTADTTATYATYGSVGCFAGCWNTTGHAAISLPWWTEEPMPHAIQLVTAPGGEDVLLQLANQLTGIHPDEMTFREARL